jgi:hypothetical protein
MPNGAWEHFLPFQTNIFSFLNQYYETFLHVDESSLRSDFMFHGNIYTFLFVGKEPNQLKCPFSSSFSEINKQELEGTHDPL